MRLKVGEVLKEMLRIIPLSKNRNLVFSHKFRKFEAIHDLLFF